MSETPGSDRIGRLVPPGGDGGLSVRRVVVGIDDSESGLAALREAIDIAQSHGAPLLAVRAWALGLPRHGGRRHRHLAHPHVVLYFSDREQRAASRVLTKRAFEQAAGRVPAGLDVEIKTPAGDPGVILSALARQPGDLLVIGHGRHVSPRGVLHGSVTAYCLRHAVCPVVVVPRERSHPPRRALSAD